MNGFLPMHKFFEINKLYHADKFKEENLFAYLHKQLNSWLNSLLKEYGVHDKPVIHGKVAAGAFLEGPIYIEKGAVVEPAAMIVGPCYIGANAQVRHTAYIRGNVYVGRDAVVGHATEVKGSVFLDGAKAGHFAYVGDSLLGRDVNLGAGTKLANLKLDKSEIHFCDPTSNKRLSSGQNKFGAVVGDCAQTGCNVVLYPGTLLMPNTAVLSTSFRGTLQSGIRRPNI